MQVQKKSTLVTDHNKKVRCIVCGASGMLLVERKLWDGDAIAQDPYKHKWSSLHRVGHKRNTQPSQHVPRQSSSMKCQGEVTSRTNGCGTIHGNRVPVVDGAKRSPLGACSIDSSSNQMYESFKRGSRYKTKSMNSCMLSI